MVGPGLSWYMEILLWWHLAWLMLFHGTCLCSSFGRNLKSGLMGDLQGRMWAVLGYLVAENYQLVVAGGMNFKKKYTLKSEQLIS